MSASGADELWGQAAERIRSARGWSLRPLARLGRPRESRRVWLAEGEPGTVVVKASANPGVAARAEWAVEALSVLAGRGYPAPQMLWHGMLDTGWSLLVQARLQGERLSTLDGSALDGLLDLVDLQADPNLDIDPGGWDVSWWIDLVLFEGWEHWWENAEAAAPATSRRLRAFLGPAAGHRLTTVDIVHGDFNLTNVLTGRV